MHAHKPIMEWIDGFLRRHRARFDPADWPKEGEDYAVFLRGWFVALKLEMADEDTADRASESLVTNPPRFRRDHIPAVCAAIRAAKGTLPGGYDNTANTTDGAEAASRDCPYCRGLGRAYRALPDGRPWQVTTSRGAAHMVPAVLFACVCPLGRLLLKPSSRGERSSFLDLASRLATTVDAHPEPPPGTGPRSLREFLPVRLAEGLRHDRRPAPPRTAPLDPETAARVRGAPNIAAGPDGRLVTLSPDGRLPVAEPTAAEEPPPF